jgi:hypothetical protein
MANEMGRVSHWTSVAPVGSCGCRGLRRVEPPRIALARSARDRRQGWSRHHRGRAIGVGASALAWLPEPAWLGRATRGWGVTRGLVLSRRLDRFRPAPPSRRVATFL